MNGFWKLTEIKIKLFLREPAALFFTLFFAPMVLLVFGEIYGNKPLDLFGGRGTVDISVPSYIAIIIAGVGLISLPIATASSRERGEFRRLNLIPFSPVLYMFTDILVYFLMVLSGVALLIIISILRYHARFEGNIPETIFGLTLSIISFFSFGYLIAAFSPTGRIAQSIGMSICYPMMFLSGAGMPLELMPSHIKTISDFLPLKYVVLLLRGLWIGDSSGAHYREIIVLSLLLIISVFITKRRFYHQY